VFLLFFHFENQFGCDAYALIPSCQRDKLDREQLHSLIQYVRTDFQNEQLHAIQHSFDMVIQKIRIEQVEDGVFSYILKCGIIKNKLKSFDSLFE
jgi:hypothetical protein